MKNNKNRKPIVWGVILVLVLAIGVTAAFAQTNDNPDVPAVEVPAEDGTLPPAQPFAHGEGNGRSNPNNGPRGDRGNDSEALADALGITVEELEAAKEGVRTAAIEQAVADGLITQEQADQILSGEGRGFMPRGGQNSEIDFEALLADELGISVEELQAAQEAVRAAQLEQAIEDGLITQEQADMMAARKAVNEYVDREALQEMMQDAYETAVQQALDNGDITQEQADQLLSNETNFGPGGLGGQRGQGRPGGPGGRGGHGFSAPQGNGNFPEAAPTTGNNA